MNDENSTGSKKMGSEDELESITEGKCQPEKCRYGASVWGVKSRQSVYENKVLTLQEHLSFSRVTGTEATFSVINCPTWVNIIALTEDNNVVLVRQYRPGSGEISLEIPGGMMDPEDENPMEAARRELLEETGFAGEKMSELGKIRPNPALQNNYCYTYLVRDAKQIAEPSPDTSEEISVEYEHLSKIRTLISSGRIDHSLVVVAFAWFFGLGEDVS